MIKSSTFTIKIKGGQETLQPYYFFSRQTIRGSEIPLIQRIQGEYFSNFLLKDPRLVSPLYESLTIRVYTSLNQGGEYFDFENELNVKRSQNKIEDIQLIPRKKFFRLEKPTFIGTYNPFVAEDGSQKLENYFVGYALGVTHQVTQLNFNYFEIVPVLYAPIDIEKLKDEISKQNIPFVGYKSIEMC